MSVQSEIARIQSAVKNAISAINDKGVSVPETAGVAELATYIEQIAAGTAGIKMVKGEFIPNSTDGAPGIRQYTIMHDMGVVPTHIILMCIANGSSTNTYAVNMCYYANGEVVMFNAKSSGTAVNNGLNTITVSLDATTAAFVLDSFTWFRNNNIHRYFIWREE